MKVCDLLRCPSCRFGSSATYFLPFSRSGSPSDGGPVPSRRSSRAEVGEDKDVALANDWGGVSGHFPQTPPLSESSDPNADGAGRKCTL